MKKPITHSLLFCCIFLLACSSGFCQKKKPARKSGTTKTTQQAGQADAGAADDAIKNAIQFTSKGFQVSEAYLMFDDENPVPSGNKINLNQNVNLILIIDSGWNEIGERVYPGSKQVIKLGNGEEILQTDDLFSPFDETGVAGTDARYIALTAVITEVKDKRKPFFVNFRVWDKKGTAEIKGTYKLFIR